MSTQKEKSRKRSGKEAKNLNPAHMGSGINSNYKKKERTKSKQDIVNQYDNLDKPDKEAFIQAIQNKRKVRLTLKADKSGDQQSKLYVPIDLKSKEKSKKEEQTEGKEYSFLFWDDQQDAYEKEIELNEEDIHSMEFVKDEFDPSEYEFWDRKWSVERDWDEYR